MRALEGHLLGQLERSHRFFWHRLRWRALRFHLPADRPFRLVDVGAGAGLLGEELARRRPDVRYGFVEPLESLERSLEERFGVDANYRHRERLTGVEFVALMDVIEHLEEDRAFLSELVGRMEADARLLLTVPALAHLWSGWDVALGHFRRYDKPGLRRLVAGLPVRVIEASYLHPEMVPLGWWRKLRRPTADAAADADAAQFPRLPGAVNDLLYAAGLPSLHLRRWSPLGTTLFAVLERVGR